MANHCLLDLEDQHLQVRVHADASLQILVKASGTQWRSGTVAIQDDGPIDEGRVWLRTERGLQETYAGRFIGERLDQAGQLRFTLLDRLREPVGSFTCSFALEEGALRLRLLSIADSLPSLIFPPALEAASLVVPSGVGQWIRKPLAGRQVRRFWSSLNMRWFGGLQADEDQGYLAIYDQGHHDCGLFLSQLHACPVFLRSLGSWRPASFPRSILYRFVAGGYVGLARAFRAYAIERGLHRSLDEKIARLPDLDHLHGGRELNVILGEPRARDRFLDQLQPVPPDLVGDEPDLPVAMTFDQAAEAAEAARELGLRKGVLMLRGWIQGGYDESHPDVWPPDERFGGEAAMRRALKRRPGMVGAVHDNYADIYRQSPSFPEGVCRMADGSLMPGGYWSGGQSFILRYDASLRYLKRNWQQLKTLDLGKIYTDTITAVFLNESHEADHPYSRADDQRHKEAFLAFLAEQNLVTSSEEVADFAVPYLGSGDTTFQRRVDDQVVTIPLWPLVFHDALFLGRHNRNPPDASGAEHIPWYLPSMLWGCFTMWSVCDGFRAHDWKRGFTEANVVDDWHHQVGTADLTRHRFLSEDCAVEQTEFSSGQSLIANFAAEPREVDGQTIPAGGHLILD